MNTGSPQSFSKPQFLPPENRSLLMRKHKGLTTFYLCGLLYHQDDHNEAQPPGARRVKVCSSQQDSGNQKGINSYFSLAEAVPAWVGRRVWEDGQNTLRRCCFRAPCTWKCQIPLRGRLPEVGLKRIAWKWVKGL